VAWDNVIFCPDDRLVVRPIQYGQCFSGEKRILFCERKYFQFACLADTGAISHAELPAGKSHVFYTLIIQGWFVVLDFNSSLGSRFVAV
jgi:hypothetical protein